MRFDPRLIQPDDAPLDAAGEIELPDDLAELAAQLRDDAAYLASVYPASALGESADPLVAEESPGEVTVAEAVSLKDRSALTAERWPNKWRGLSLFVSTSCAVLAVMLAAATYLANREGASTTIAESPATSLTESPASELADAAMPRHMESLDAPRQAAPASVFLNGVSGPEMEGLIDLWQQDGEQATRIEI